MMATTNKLKWTIFIGVLALVFLTYVCSLIEANESFRSPEDSTLEESKLSDNTIADTLGETIDSTEDEQEDEDKNDKQDPTSTGRQGATSEPREKFSWKHHPDDHGVYSGRSLMSTANIKHDRLESSDSLQNQDEEEEEEDPAEISSGKQSMRRTKLRRYSVGEDEDDQQNPLRTSHYAEREWQLMFRSIDQAYDSMASSMIQQIGKQTNLFDEIVGRLKPDCRRDIYYTRDAAKKHRLWALRMLDSNGKIPSGITYGRFSSPGDYEECLSVRVDDLVLREPNNKAASAGQRQQHLERHKFHGKYCLIDFRLPLPERPHDKLLSVHEPVLNLTGTQLLEEFPDFANYTAYASVFYEVGYMHGFCLPSSCEVTDLTRSMGRALEGMHLIVNNTVDCEERPDEPLPLRKSQIISLALLTVLFLNAACASFAHYMLPKEAQNQPLGRPLAHVVPLEQQPAKGQQPSEAVDDTTAPRKEEEVEKQQDNSRSLANFKLWLARTAMRNKFYSDCFSVQKNFERLAKPDPRGLTFVHYTRIVAMALTVITHTAGLGTLQAITKPADASNSEQIFRDLIPQMLANAFTSIQIFFFMAGFMLVISTYPSIKRDRGHISFLEYATKRAIRLMPGIAATICLNFLWPLFVDGPMLTYFIRLIVVPCETNWWRTLGFISNFDHVEKMCLRHSYFSASDYQLHVMAFPLLILLYKQPTVSLILAGLLTLGGFLAQVIMFLTKTLMPFMMVDYIDKEAFFNVVHYVHHPVWNHMSAFFYGFIIGYFVVRQIRIELSPKTVRWTWLILMPLGVASIFAPYYWNHYKRPIYRWQMILYVIFDRFILLTTCAWLSYATMVLGRKPPSKPASGQIKSTTNEADRGSQATLSNLPNIVTLTPDGQGEKQGEKPQVPAATMEPAIGTLEATTNGGLRANSSQSSIPRQRSSPNFHITAENQMNSRMGRAISSMNLVKTASSSNLKSMDAAGDQQQVTEAPQQRPVVGDTTKMSRPNDIIPPEKPTEQGSRQQARRSAPQTSNVNTLCLILSRLTFQLYLFNMVVLWVDVNHSKYYWFFSYYFIITKAFAVYICSTLMAMIFFVTLESPSLTLYIAWVKSRAVARARRQERRAQDLMKPPGTGEKEEATPAPGATVDMPAEERPKRPQMEQQTQIVNFTRTSPTSSTSGKSNMGTPFEGLSMRVGGSEQVKPTFSFIDLSSPTAAPLTAPHGEEFKSSDEQTRM